MFQLSASDEQFADLFSDSGSLSGESAPLGTRLQRVQFFSQSGEPTPARLGCLLIANPTPQIVR